MNSTYYSALGCNDQAYLAARAVQFFLPGVPQVYYVGAMAGPNDMDLLHQTGNGRDINRHRYSMREVDENLRRPVVRALNALCRLRNGLDAFDGAFSSRMTDTGLLLDWAGQASWARLAFTPARGLGGDAMVPVASLEWEDGQGSHRCRNLLELEGLVPQV